jgi:hypothetical protein
MLLPKFASHFPERLEAVVSSLIKLSCQEASEEQDASLVQACSQSAWQGLGLLCGVAAHAQQDKPLTKATEHLLRCYACSSCWLLP